MAEKVCSRSLQRTKFCWKIRKTREVMAFGVKAKNRILGLTRNFIFDHEVVIGFC